MTEPTEDRARPRRIFGRTIPQIVTWLVAVALLAVFILQNQALVRVEFLVWTVETRLVWALFVAAVLGFIVGAFRLRPSRRR